MTKNVISLEEYFKNNKGKLKDTLGGFAGVYGESGGGLSYHRYPLEHSSESDSIEIKNGLACNTNKGCGLVNSIKFLLHNKLEDTPIHWSDDNLKNTHLYEINTKSKKPLVFTNDDNIAGLINLGLFLGQTASETTGSNACDEFLGSWARLYKYPKPGSVTKEEYPSQIFNDALPNNGSVENKDTWNYDDGVINLSTGCGNNARDYSDTSESKEFVEEGVYKYVDKNDNIQKQPLEICKVDPNMHIIGDGIPWQEERNTIKNVIDNRQNWAWPPTETLVNNMKPNKEEFVKKRTEVAGKYWPQYCGPRSLQKTLSKEERIVPIDNTKQGQTIELDYENVGFRENWNVGNWTGPKQLAQNQEMEYDASNDRYVVWISDPKNPGKMIRAHIKNNVEGCCWWGRGAIQTTGIVNYSVLNHLLGDIINTIYQKSDKIEGTDNLNFCTAPNLVCKETEYLQSDKVIYPGSPQWTGSLIYWLDATQKLTWGQFYTATIDRYLGFNNCCTANEPIPYWAEGDGESELVTKFRKKYKLFKEALARYNITILCEHTYSDILLLLSQKFTKISDNSPYFVEDNIMYIKDSHYEDISVIYEIISYFSSWTVNKPVGINFFEMGPKRWSTEVGWRKERGLPYTVGTLTIFHHLGLLKRKLPPISDLTPCDECSDILTMIKDNNHLNKLHKIINHLSDYTGWIEFKETLDNNNFTIFAPKDDAILNINIEEISHKHLLEYIKYHIVMSPVNIDGLSNYKSNYIDTANSKQLHKRKERSKGIKIGKGEQGKFCYDMTEKVCGAGTGNSSTEIICPSSYKEGGCGLETDFEYDCDGCFTIIYINNVKIEKPINAKNGYIYLLNDVICKDIQECVSYVNTLSVNHKSTLHDSIHITIIEDNIEYILKNNISIECLNAGNKYKAQNGKVYFLKAGNKLEHSGYANTYHSVSINSDLPVCNPDLPPLLGSKPNNSEYSEYITNFEHGDAVDDLLRSEWQSNSIDDFRNYITKDDNYCKRIHNPVKTFSKLEEAIHFCSNSPDLCKCIDNTGTIYPYAVFNTKDTIHKHNCSHTAYVRRYN